MNTTVTLIIHGTFAEDATWWRLGSEGQVTFADRLEQALAARGLVGTVWKPALDAGLDYQSFSWSGLNRHRDRVRAARQLSASLNMLAEQARATGPVPMTVNFVAHSHGGNVVLEALRHLNENVRVRRVVLLDRHAKNRYLSTRKELNDAYVEDRQGRHLTAISRRGAAGERRRLSSGRLSDRFAGSCTPKQ